MFSNIANYPGSALGAQENSLRTVSERFSSDFPSLARQIGHELLLKRSTTVETSGFLLWQGIGLLYQVSAVIARSALYVRLLV